jgi:hypothetical protein
MAARGRNTWFGAFDWAMLAIGLIAAALASFRAGVATCRSATSAKERCAKCCCVGKLPVAWGVLSIVGAALGLLNYLFAVLRLADWTTFMIASACARLALHAIILPAWTAWLGLLICRAHKAAQGDNRRPLMDGVGEDIGLSVPAFGDGIGPADL